MLQPVLVRQAGDGYELIAGERRWRAARRVGLQTIPALVRETDDAAALEQALVENVHRDDLNLLEEAAAYQQLIEDFGLTHDEVAARVGRSRATVTNTLRLLQLPPSIQKSRAATGTLSMGHARALLGTPGPRRSRSSSPSGSSPRTSRSGPSRTRSASTRARATARPRGDRRGRRPASTRPAEAAPAGAARARGAARRPPRDPGDDLDGSAARQGRGRVLDPRGPRADLPAHHRRHAATHAITCARNYSSASRRSVGRLFDAAPDPADDCLRRRRRRGDERAHARRRRRPPTGSQITAAMRVSRRIA